MVEQLGLTGDEVKITVTWICKSLKGDLERSGNL